MSERKGQLGETFEAYLREQGTLAETTAVAVKRILAWQLQQAMTEQQISKNQMAKAMQTSRSQLDRILDPDNDSIQLATLLNAARVLGRELRIELI